MVTRYRPMLLATSTEPFHRPGWVYEEKVDGWRLVAHKRGDRVDLVSRQGREWTRTFGELADAIRALPVRTAILDGEVARYDERLVSRFDLLSDDGGQAVATPPVYAAFDLLEVDGRELLGEPLTVRRVALEGLLTGTAPLLFPVRRLALDGLQAFAEAERRGWEGVVGKDPRSRYVPGERTGKWVKAKVRHVDQVVVGAIVVAGELEGAIKVGVRDGAALRYAGTVQWGLQGQKRIELLEAAQALTRKSSPFHDERSGEVVYLEPLIEIEVQHFGWLAGGLRDPVYRRLVVVGPRRRLKQRRGGLEAGRRFLDLDDWPLARR